MRIRRRFLWLFSCIMMMALSQQESLAESSAEKLVVGVRADANPFSYKVLLEPAAVERGPLGRAGYAGYVVGICDEILEALIRSEDMEVEVREVDANSRFERLGPRALESESIDILCDPATLTAHRLSRFMGSAPIYLSGITFATRGETVPQQPPCASVIGVVGDTTSAAAEIRQILSTGNLAVYTETLSSFIADPDKWLADREPTTSESEKCNKMPGVDSASGEQKPAIFYARTHTELADAFCKGDVLHYVGDIEIVNRQLRTRKNCDYTDAALTYTDERYSIYARTPQRDQPRKAYSILKFYEELARQIHSPSSILLHHFEETFPNYTASRKLQALYWSLIGTFPGASR